MRQTQVTLPELALVAGTRVALGAGLGLLLAGGMSESQRKAVGWTLVLVGALTTIPLAFEILGGQRLSAPAEGREQAVSGPRSDAHERPGQRQVLARS